MCAAWQAVSPHLVWVCMLEIEGTSFVGPRQSVALGRLWAQYVRVPFRASNPCGGGRSRWAPVLCARSAIRSSAISVRCRLEIVIASQSNAPRSHLATYVRHARARSWHGDMPVSVGAPPPHCGDRMPPAYGLSIARAGHSGKCRPGAPLAGTWSTSRLSARPALAAATAVDRCGGGSSVSQGQGAKRCSVGGRGVVVFGTYYNVVLFLLGPGAPSRRSTNQLVYLVRGHRGAISHDMRPGSASRHCILTSGARTAPPKSDLVGFVAFVSHSSWLDFCEDLFAMPVY